MTRAATLPPNADTPSDPAEEASFAVMVIVSPTAYPVPLARTVIVSELPAELITCLRTMPLPLPLVEGSLLKVPVIMLEPCQLVLPSPDVLSVSWSGITCTTPAAQCAAVVSRHTLFAASAPVPSRAYPGHAALHPSLKSEST